MSDLRKATANRLNECFCSPPSPPPSHVIPISVFEEMMYKVAYLSGYTGGKENFSKNFVEALNNNNNILNENLVVQKDSIDNFPKIGSENAIYIDTSSRQAFFWKNNNYHKIGTGSVIIVPEDGGTGEGGDPSTPSNENIVEGGEL